jgi:hypothetical protein
VVIESSAGSKPGFLFCPHHLFPRLITYQNSIITCKQAVATALFIKYIQVANHINDQIYSA